MKATSAPAIATPGPTAVFWQNLREGRFLLQRSRSTGRYVFYPRVLVPSQGAQDLEWVPASGRGVVYSATTVRRRADRGGDFNISIVELEEGPRLTTRVLGMAPDRVAIGMNVSARIEPPRWLPGGEQEQPVLVFHAAGPVAP